MSSYSEGQRAYDVCNRNLPLGWITIIAIITFPFIYGCEKVPRTEFTKNTARDYNVGTGCPYSSSAIHKLDAEILDMQKRIIQLEQQVTELKDVVQK